VELKLVRHREHRFTVVRTAAYHGAIARTGYQRCGSGAKTPIAGYSRFNAVGDRPVSAPLVKKSLVRFGRHPDVLAYNMGDWRSPRDIEIKWADIARWLLTLTLTVVRL